MGSPTVRGHFILPPHGGWTCCCDDQAIGLTQWKDVHKWPLGAVNRKCHQFRTIWSVEQGLEGFGKLEVNIKDKRFIQALRPSTDLFSLPSLVDWMRWNWVKMAKVTLIPRAKSQVWSTNRFHKLWLNKKSSTPRGDVFLLFPYSGFREMRFCSKSGIKGSSLR